MLLLTHRAAVVCLAFACTALPQTPSEYDIIKQSLLLVQQKAVESLSILDAPARPPNWQTLVSTQMYAAADAATRAATTALSATATRLVSVPAGASLQAAVNAALPGDTLVLQAGATYAGPVMLPVKSGTGWVTITTSAQASLPAGRVTPAHAALMPKISSTTASQAFIATNGAHHYRLSGLEITCAGTNYCNTLVQIGAGTESTDSALPHSIELDRVYVHGTTGGGKRGVQMNGKSIVLRNSHLSGFFSSWQETQAVGAWNTPGPLQVENNYLEASGVGLMIGGTEPALVGATPSDIQIVSNHITRPLEWRPKNYMVKNLLELKTGRRVRITGNLLENSWTSSQVGYAFNIKRGTENIKTPPITADVLIEGNIIRRTAAAAVISSGSSNVTLRNNLFQDIGPPWGAAATFGVYQAPNTTIENNTVVSYGPISAVLQPDAGSAPGFVFRANIVPHGTYGVKGSGTSVGLGTLGHYFPGYVFSSNVMYGAVVNPASYPTGNYFPSTLAEVGFIDPTTGKFKLSTASPYRGKGISGADPGIGTSTLF